MGKVWVLRTETKGTGASVVPLESVRSNPSSAAEPIFVPRKPGPRPQEAPQPKPPHRFRVIDVMTRETLVDDGSAREAIDVLEGIRSIVDAQVYIWQPEREGWRMLSLGEQRAMSELARRSH